MSSWEYYPDSSKRQKSKKIKNLLSLKRKYVWAYHLVVTLRKEQWCSVLLAKFNQSGQNVHQIGQKTQYTFKTVTWVYIYKCFFADFVILKLVIVK